MILDVGHTAKSPGAASSRNVDEFEFNLRLAKRIEEKLKADGFSENDRAGDGRQGKAEV